MRRTALLLVPLLLAACGDTDVANRGGELEPGQEIEDDRSWLVAGEPVFDPDVEYVGEFEGTPLYAEVGFAPPYDALYVPLEDDYWQLLEEGGAPAPDTTDTTGTAELR